MNEFSDKYAHARERRDQFDQENRGATDLSLVTTRGKNMSHRESDEGYENVIFEKGKYRVIVCKDRTQWIIQARSGKTTAGARWRNLSYHCERTSLLRVSRAYFGSPVPIELISLPEFFERGR